MTSTRINREARCPGCQTRIDGATSVGHRGKPRPGDLSVCAYCGVLLEFLTDLTLRQAPPEVFDGLDDGTRFWLALAQAAIRARAPR